MKRRVLSVALALCLCISSQSVVFASQGADSSANVTTGPQGTPTPSQAEDTEEPDGGEEAASTQDETPTPEEEGDKAPAKTPGEPDGAEEATATPDETPTPEEEGEEAPAKTPGEPDGVEEATASPSKAPTPTEEGEEAPAKTPGEPDGNEEATATPKATPSAEATAAPDETPTPTQDGEAVPTGTPGGATPSGYVSASPQKTPSASPKESIRPTETPRRSGFSAEAGRALDYPETFPSGEVDPTELTPSKVREAMIALKEDERYREGTAWTDFEPYTGSKPYRWKGGNLGGDRIAATGCVAFAFTLSDAAFGSLPNRMYAKGGFGYEDIKVGDILRVSNDAHTVIVLKVTDAGVVIAEGNNNSKIHWGRTISKDVMSNTSHYITRYPEDYISPDDPEADKVDGSGSIGGLTWRLTKAGVLTISGQGAMPDFSGVADQPWGDKGSQIQKVIIEDGVTSIGSSAFWDCGVLSVEIPSSVTTIGNSAFRGSSLISVAIPSSVKTIGDSAFRACENLSSVTISEGVETINQNAFNGCISLTSIALPASIGEVGAGTFFKCTEMTSATFASGGKQVTLGDNLFSSCWKLTNVTLPQNIDRISDGMFQSCITLTSVVIPQGAESIGENAFASCSRLYNATIPDSVTMIGRSAFQSCNVLANIYFTGTEAQWNSISKILTGISEAVTIHYGFIPPSPSPTNTPGATPSPTNAPGTSPVPTSDPGASPAPTNAPGTSPAPTSAPGTSPVPTSAPGTSPAPTNEPGATPVPTQNPGDDNNSNPGGDNPGNGSGNTSDGNNSGSNSGNNAGNDEDADFQRAESYPRTTAAINSGIREVVETWKPTTPEDKKRYACMGREAVQYTPSKENSYPVAIENAIQGPMCFKSFEAVLGDYTIGRTYNIYPPSRNTYSMDKEIEITLKIPSAIYRQNRDYKMICVTKGGRPIVYNDTDNNPETITIKTDKFYAFALIYK